MSEQTKDGGQDLHARIINLPVKPGLAMASASESHILTYKIGHRDARHAAAELAAGQEHALHLARSRILELEEALRAVTRDKSFCCLKEPTQDVARSVLNKENDRA